MIAIPDLSFGAMENWGLVTYRLDTLLYDPVVSATNNKERIAGIVSHELAHQVSLNKIFYLSLDFVITETFTATAGRSGWRFFNLQHFSRNTVCGQLSYL